MAYAPNDRKEIEALLKAERSIEDISNKFPKIPRAVIYAWRRSMNKNKSQPLYEPIAIATKTRSNAKIILICSEDPQAIIDVLKGM